jgi:ribosomal protein S18 acetylase RimI-like enzyme
MSNQMTPLRASDRQQIQEILEQTKVFRPEEIEVALEVFKDCVDEKQHEYTGVAARDGDQLLGYAIWGDTPCTRGTWDLYWIAVHPGRHSKGIGRRIMEFAEKDMRQRGGRLCIIETSGLPMYDKTRDFYLKLGYQEEARIRDYYGPGDDRVIYTRPL